MKMLCPTCFEQITTIKGNKAICCCGAEFDMDIKTSVFRVRLDGGYVKDCMSYGEVAKSIKDGSILADEYIATPNGPWITVYDSPFFKYIPKKGAKKLKNARTSVALYRKRQSARVLIVALTLLFAVSFLANVFMLTIVHRMEGRIETLVNTISGGL